MSKKKVYVLYGVAQRDANELVGMFFQSKKDRREFAELLPGRYRKMTMIGAKYDDLDFKLERS